MTSADGSTCVSASYTRNPFFITRLPQWPVEFSIHPGAAARKRLLQPCEKCSTPSGRSRNARRQGSVPPGSARITSTMPRVTYIAQDGKETTLDIAEGTSVMQAAVFNGVDGIVAEC